MTVHLAGSLPADDLNGLANAEQKLIDGYLDHRRHVVIGVVRVSGTKRTEKDGFKDNPIVSFDHIEAIPEELQREALNLLGRTFAARTGRTTLDFPEDDEEPQPALPLELEASDGVYRFEVIDEPKAKFTLRVLAPSGAVAIERHALPRRLYGEIEPGTYLQAELGNEDLIGLAGDLVRDYESGFTTADLVDAEVVDEDAEGEDAA